MTTRKFVHTLPGPLTHPPLFLLPSSHPPPPLPTPLPLPFFQCLPPFTSFPSPSNTPMDYSSTFPTPLARSFLASTVEKQANKQNSRAYRTPSPFPLPLSPWSGAIFRLLKRGLFSRSEGPEQLCAMNKAVLPSLPLRNMDSGSLPFTLPFKEQEFQLPLLFPPFKAYVFIFPPVFSPFQEHGLVLSPPPPLSRTWTPSLSLLPKYRHPSSSLLPFPNLPPLPPSELPPCLHLKNIYPLPFTPLRSPSLSPFRAWPSRPCLPPLKEHGHSSFLPSFLPPLPLCFLPFFLTPSLSSFPLSERHGHLLFSLPFLLSSSSPILSLVFSRRHAGSCGYPWKQLFQDITLFFPFLFFGFYFFL